jgi:large subunit ribosomal protein L21
LIYSPKTVKILFVVNKRDEMAETKLKKTEIQKFAVIKTGGKQYIVKEGETLNVELLDTEEGKVHDFEVLLVADGEKVEVGTPVLEKAQVKATVIGETKGEKLIVFKYKKRKNYRVKTGHRQHYTQVKIEKIELK